RPQPRTSLTVIRYTSQELRAFCTASSFSGRMTATIIFMGTLSVIGCWEDAGAHRDRRPKRVVAGARPAAPHGAAGRCGDGSGPRVDADAGGGQLRVLPQQPLHAFPRQVGVAAAEPEAVAV